MDELDRKLGAIREEYIRQMAERYGDDCNELDSVAESPIERLMGAALVAVFSLSDTLPEFHFWTGVPLSDSPIPFVTAQVPLGEMRADFVIRCPYRFRNGSLSIIVECDGHDFHEKTKEQARRDRSRDRALQASGWSVLRFTGSEIWEDAIGCARQVEQFVHRKI